MISHQTRLRARYAETDQMGVVYYANYFIWMEVGRVELCRAVSRQSDKFLFGQSRTFLLTADGWGWNE